MHRALLILAVFAALSLRCELPAATPSLALEVSESSPIEGDVVRVNLVLGDADPQDVLIPGLSINGQPVPATDLSELAFREHGLLLSLDQAGPWLFEATVTDGSTVSTTSMTLQVAARPGNTLHVGAGQSFTTIQDAADNASPGDTVQVHAGTYVETVYIDGVSGSRGGGYITLQADPGVTVSPAAGESVIFYLSGRNHLRIRDFSLTGASGSGATAIQVEGSGHHLVFSGNEIHGFSDVRFGAGIRLDNANTPGHVTDVLITNNVVRDCTVVEGFSGVGIEGSGSGIDIWNNEIRNLLPAPGADVDPDIFRPVEDYAVNATLDAIGIQLCGTKEALPLSDLVIHGNEIANCAPDQSEALTLNGNIDGFRVTGNRIRDVNNIGIDFIGGESDIFQEPGESVTLADIIAQGLVVRNGLCRGNEVIRARSNYESGFAGGIYVDGGRDIVVENNLVTQCDIGIEIGAENPGLVTSGVIVRSNLVYFNDKAGLAIGGYGVEGRDGPAQESGSVENCPVYNNTFYQNNRFDADSPYWIREGQTQSFRENIFGELWIQWASNCEIFNNIVWPSSGAALLHDGGLDLPNLIRSNLYHADPSRDLEFTLIGRVIAPDGRYEEYSPASLYGVSFPFYQGGTSGALSGDPLFANAGPDARDNTILTIPGGGRDFRLSDGASLAVDSGIAVPGGFAELGDGSRVLGGTVDRGAYEFAGVDTDGDGVSDGVEIFAGTNPFDPGSRPGFESVAWASSGNAVELSWKSVPGRTYCVCISADLLSWQPLGALVSGDGSVKVRIDPVESRTRRFYRLEISRP